MGVSIAASRHCETLDLRDLPAPAPLVRALEAADALLPGDMLELLTPMLPLPLIEALGERGLRTTARRLPDGSAQVFVQCVAEPAARDGQDQH